MENVRNNKVEVKGTAKLFDNPILEALTRTNPSITLSLYLPMIVLTFYFGITYFQIPVQAAVLLFLFAMIFWTFIEYLMHRYIYHFINDNKYVKTFHYYVHGVHHHYPKDQSRLFLPPVPGLVMSALFLGTFYLVLGKYAFPFFSGFVVGYLIYVFTHYAIHKYKKPKNFWGYLWVHHNLHHFKHDDKAYGVSTPLWDYVFNTMPPLENRDEEK